MSTTGKVWLKHYPDEIPHSLDYQNNSLHDYLLRSARKYPDQIAIEFLGKRLSYSELHQQAVQFAQGLQALGVEKGDRIAIMLANCPQAVISYYGIIMTGAIAVQINPLYVERELKHQLIDSGAKVLVCLDLVFPRVQNVRMNTSLQQVIVTSIKDYLPFPKNLLYPIVQKGKVTVEYNEQTVAFSAFLKQGGGAFKPVPLDPETDLALLQYTGGTTGLAKGVMLTHQNLVVNTMQAGHWIYRTTPGEERMLAVLPFFHVYGMTVCMNLAIMNGFTLILLPKFEPLQVLKAIEKHRVTLFPGAPTMYIALIHQPEIETYDLSSVLACLSGAAPLPQEVQQTFERLTGGKLVEGYGLTETAPVLTANPIWGRRKSGSIGIPWPDTEMIVRTADGQEADPGEIGEIAVRGPQVMQGYWNMAEETERVLQGGWLLTGDMGYMDEDGFFYIVDRKKDMIIAGGFNIFPREIEEVLYEHEAIQEVAIIGVPDSYRGETVKAFIVPKEGRDVTAEELDQFCRARLAAYKVPHLYEFRSELPKTMVGKVLRRVLLEEEKGKGEEDQESASS